MEGLADDPDFTGKLIVGIAPGLFFSGFEFQPDLIDAYEEETPAQWFGHKVSVLFEPWLAFYTPDLALPMIIERQPLPIREGADYEPEVAQTGHPRARPQCAAVETPGRERGISGRGARYLGQRAGYPWPSARRNGRNRPSNRAPSKSTGLWRPTRNSVPGAVEVVFAVLPYDGHYAVSEPDGNPRELSWDVLIETHRCGWPAL